MTDFSDSEVGEGREIQHPANLQKWEISGMKYLKTPGTLFQRGLPFIESKT
jgi:hypothetical protein